MSRKVLEPYAVKYISGSMKVLEECFRGMSFFFTAEVHEYVFTEVRQRSSVKFGGGRVY